MKTFEYLPFTPYPFSGEQKEDALSLLLQWMQRESSQPLTNEDRGMARYAIEDSAMKYRMEEGYRDPIFWLYGCSRAVLYSYGYSYKKPR